MLQRLIINILKSAKCYEGTRSIKNVSKWGKMKNKLSIASINSEEFLMSIFSILLMSWLQRSDFPDEYIFHVLVMFIDELITSLHIIFTLAIFWDYFTQYYDDVFIFVPNTCNYFVDFLVHLESLLERLYSGVCNFYCNALSDKISADKSAENLACCRKFCPPKFCPIRYVIPGIGVYSLTPSID